MALKNVRDQWSDNVSGTALNYEVVFAGVRPLLSVETSKQQATENVLLKNGIDVYYRAAGDKKAQCALTAHHFVARARACRALYLIKKGRHVTIGNNERCLLIPRSGDEMIWL